MKKIIFLSLLIFIGAGCHQKSEMNNNLGKHSESLATTSTSSYNTSREDLSMPPPKTKNHQKTINEPNVEKGSKIIKEGNLRIESEDVNSTKEFIDSIVKKFKVYYEKESYYNSDYREKYDLKLRIPSANFHGVVNALEGGVDKILGKNINAKDVTEEYLDLEIRLENNRAYLKRYNQLLSKAKTIKEMVQIQEKVRQIEMSIDVNMGKMKYLNDRANYSTLSIELSSKPKEVIAEAPPGYFHELLDAVKRGFSGLLTFILIVVNIWPIILGIVIIWLIRSRIFGFLGRKKSVSAN